MDENNNHIFEIVSKDATYCLNCPACNNKLLLKTYKKQKFEEDVPVDVPVDVPIIDVPVDVPIIDVPIIDVLANTPKLSDENETLQVLEMLYHGNDELKPGGINPHPNYTWNFGIYLCLIEIINFKHFTTNNVELYAMCKDKEVKYKKNRGFSIFPKDVDNRKFQKKVHKTLANIMDIALMGDFLIQTISKLDITVDKYRDIVNGNINTKTLMSCLVLDQKIKTCVHNILCCLPFLIHTVYWSNGEVYSELTKEDYIREMNRFVRDCVISKKNI
jgi:hypothetical protein